MLPFNRKLLNEKVKTDNRSNNRNRLSKINLFKFKAKFGEFFILLTKIRNYFNGLITVSNSVYHVESERRFCSP